ncbi:transposase [Candidatus Tenderia electrophaga]|uniref:Transposase n=1 Tax=Candidatus Tenderia electrophaga TaxID=1748243 RepID=A0A0S2TH78_9GAMM|nr:transposase [Candidatus Tenderia electrophaga]ALP54521.1 transposase [Candidatus Tenderia electrophaga]
MKLSHTAKKHQHTRVEAYRGNSNSYRFFNLLTSDTLLDKVEALLPEHRERLYPPTETLSMFLAQAMSADRSCQSIVNQAAVQRLAGGFSARSTYTGGYCRARQRLPLTMVAELTQHLGDQLDERAPDEWQWQGRHIRIIDGTTVTMPDTAANQAVFPQQRGQQPGLGFPICRIVGITSLASGALLNAAIGRFNGKGGDEQTLLRAIQNTLQPGDIALGDAFFATYFFIAAMQADGIDILMEQNGSRKRVTDFRLGQRLGERDHLIVIDKPKRRPEWMSEEDYNTAPERLTVREFQAGGKTMITTLDDHNNYPKEKLKALYKMRWHIELDLRNIKDTMGMNVLSCKTPEMAIKEIWIHLLAYNLIRLMMAQSALLADISPRRISFKHCLQIWLIYLQNAQYLDDEYIGYLFRMMVQKKVGNRPGRIEPRAVKRRPKAYPLLTRTRHEARAEVMKNGHPKKLK